MMRRGFSPPKLIIILSLVIILVFGFLTFTSIGKTGVQRSPLVTPEMQQKYLPIWKELVLYKNKISEDYFTKHITPKKTYLLKEVQLGERFVVNYQFKLDWVEFEVADSIVVKPNEDDHYLSIEELKERGGANLPQNNQNFAQEKLYYIINPIVEVNSVIKKDEADKKLAECENIKPAPNPVSFDSFKISVTKVVEGKEGLDTSKLRLIYRGFLIGLDNKTAKISEVDLSSGEINCVKD